MQSLENMTWRTFSGREITGSILDEVRTTIEKETANGSKLKVCIGSDSQVYGSVIEFGTVIVFLREGRGGFMFIANERSTQRMTLKERLLYEVSRSITVAYALCPILDAYQLDLEVHADINTNPNFQSNTALQEAMGYILSMGFVFRAKPDSFASSSCENKVV